MPASLRIHCIFVFQEEDVAAEHEEKKNSLPGPDDECKNEIVYDE
jgi:hypothetical protein